MHQIVTTPTRTQARLDIRRARVNKTSIQTTQEEAIALKEREIGRHLRMVKAQLGISGYKDYWENGAAGLDGTRGARGSFSASPSSSVAVDQTPCRVQQAARCRIAFGSRIPTLGAGVAAATLATISRGERTARLHTDISGLFGMRVGVSGKLISPGFLDCSRRMVEAYVPSLVPIVARNVIDELRVIPGRHNFRIMLDQAQRCVA